MGVDLAATLKLNDRLTGALKKPQASISRFVKSSVKNIFSLQGAFVGLSVFGVARLIQSTASAADSIGKLSDRIGVSTEFIGKFRFAAQQSGSDLLTVDKALETITKRFGEFAQFGTGAGKDAIEKLGLAQAVKDGKAFEDVLVEIIKGLKGVNQAGKVAITTGLFGRSAGSLVNVLQTDPGELKKLFAQASIVSSGDAKTAASFNDTLGRLKETMKSFSNDVIIPLLPLLEGGIALLGTSIKTVTGQLQEVDTRFVGPQRLGAGAGGRAILSPTQRAFAQGRGGFGGLSFAPGSLEPGGRIAGPERATGFLGPQGQTAKSFVSPSSSTRDFTQGLGEPASLGFGRKQTDIHDELAKTTNLLHGIELGIGDVTKAFSTLSLARGVIASIAFSLTDGISGGLSSILEGTKSVKDGFADMAKSVLRDLSRIIIQGLVARSVGGLFTGIAGLFSPGSGVSPTIAASGLSASDVSRAGESAGIGSFSHGGFVKPGQIVQATLHGGKFGERITPLQSRFNAQSAVGSGGGGTTIIYNITAIDVEDFDNKILASIARRDGDVSSIVAAHSRNSGTLRASLGIAG